MRGKKKQGKGRKGKGRGGKKGEKNEKGGRIKIEAHVMVERWVKWPARKPYH